MVRIAEHHDPDTAECEMAPVCPYTSYRRINGIEQIRRQPASVSGYWVYTLLAERRDDLHRALAEAGIHSSKLHLRNDVYSCFGTGLADLPGVERFSARRLCIPCGWWVTEEDRERISARICAGW